MFRITKSAFFTIAVFASLLLTACEPGPPKITGTVPSTDGVPIRYHVAGKGETALVFVHGWSCDSSYWDGQVDRFARNYTVVTLDLAGHGESGMQRKVYGMPAFGADVAAVVKKLDLKRVVLIGHSMGGPVIVEAAGKIPKRVIGLVGVDTFNTGFQWPAMEKIPEFIKPFKKDFPKNTEDMVRSMFPPKADAAVVDRIAKDMAAAPPAVGVSAMHELLVWAARDAAAALRTLPAPLRNINADPEGKNKPKGDDVVLVSGVGHFIPQEDPARFNRVLGEIVAQFERR